MIRLLVFIFFSTMILCTSTYLFYPVIMFLVGTFFSVKIHKEDVEPTVSIIISAFNEEKYIRQKIRNTLDLDYPRDKLEILVGSDGSTDKTPHILLGLKEEGLTVKTFDENRGKTAVQNDLVGNSNGEILIFTDAASFLNTDAIRKIVRNFADERVGCVAGRMVFVNTGTNITTESQGLYWKYELKIREMESSIGRMIGVDGPLYAIRRQYYMPLKHNMISDLISPLLVLNQGAKVILEPEAIVEEHPKLETDQEMNTRRRITLRALIGISHYPEILNPLKNPTTSLQLFFHKVLRWFVGPLVILNFLSSFALRSRWLFGLVNIMYIVFIIFAALGWFGARFGIKNRLLTVPYYFTIVNAAATMGIVDFLKNRQATTWSTIRD